MSDLGIKPSLPVAPVDAQEAPSGREIAAEVARCALEQFFAELDGDYGEYAPTDATEDLMRAALAALTQSGVDEPRPGADTEAEIRAKAQAVVDAGDGTFTYHRPLAIALAELAAVLDSRPEAASEVAS